jgi:hypothetical protein
MPTWLLSNYPTGRQLHDGMCGTVIHGGERPERFPIQTGAKQGCVQALILFTIFLAGLLIHAMENIGQGVANPVQIRW